MKEGKLFAFHGKQKIKDQYLRRLELHKAADEIIKGRYWEDGKGCAVGCTVHSNQHNAYETELGIPMVLAKLEDRIFEGMSNDKAKEFPIKFLSAINVGADLSNVWRKLMIWVLVDPENGVIKFAKTDKTRKAIQDVADAFGDSLINSVPREKWLELRRNAYAADAYAAAAAAAAAAADAYAADAYAAAAAADAYAADAYAAAAYAADAYAVSAAAADAAARKKHFDLMAEKLIDLLAEEK